MTDREYLNHCARQRRLDGRLCPSEKPRGRRKIKLKMRYGDRLEAEIDRTREKLELLIEIQAERS